MCELVQQDKPTKKTSKKVAAVEVQESRKNITNSEVDSLKYELKVVQSALEESKHNFSEVEKERELLVKELESKNETIEELKSKSRKRFFLNKIENIFF
jgi:hypothetical protein